MSWAVWITGRPNGAAPAVARAVADAIAADGEPVALLGVDEIYRLLTPALTSSDAERDLVHRALVYVASTLVEAGVPVIIEATGDHRAWCDLARAVITQFAAVHLVGPSLAGADEPDDVARAPELTVDTTEDTPEAGARRVVAAIAGWRRTPPATIAERWAMWITGLPGSGKTTIASRVAEALAARGLSVRILDLADVRAFLNDAWSPLAEDIAHRALVSAAERLTDAGIAVIIDATAPVRAWRSLARERIARFAEVQLVCPAEICANRERAVRWRLLGCAHRQAPPRAADRPDIVLAYEPAVSPELTSYTDVEDPWSTVDTVLRLAARLSAAGDVRVA